MAVFIKQVNIPQSIPQKSDLINIDMTGSGTPQLYRVLKVSNTIAEVLSMSRASSQKLASSGQTYENGVLDTYLNTTWYNTLSVTAKSAIVDKTFRQDNWYRGTSGNPDYQGKYQDSGNDTAYRVSLANASFGNEITRHCYAISVQDVLDYLEVTPQMTQSNTTLTYDNVWTMFWNDSVASMGQSILLRSADASRASYAFFVYGNPGSLDRNWADSIRTVRPAFQIDLSKIDYTFADDIELKPISVLQKSNSGLSRVGFSYNVKPQSAHCTVSGLGSENPLDVQFVKGLGFTKEGLGIEEVVFGGDTFIKIPTMYRKINEVTDDQITSFTISNQQEDNDFHPYSVFIDENGNMLDYVLYGKYWNTDSSSMVSTQEANPKAMGIDSARTKARNRGAGYLLYDWQFQKLWQDLIICFKGTINTNSGTAWSYDELGIFWGPRRGVLEDGCWVDGVSGNIDIKEKNGVWIFSDKPSTYINSPTASSSGYKTASYAEAYSSTREIVKLGYDSNNEFFNYPSDAVVNSNHNTYYCDGVATYNYYTSSGIYPVRADVGFYSLFSGAFCCYADDGWSYTWLVRLCYRPLN